MTRTLSNFFISFSLVLVLAIPYQAEAQKKKKAQKKIKAGEEVLSSENGYDCFRDANGRIKSGKVVVKKKGNFFKAFRPTKKQKARLRKANKRLKKLNRILKKKGELNAKQQAQFDKFEAQKAQVSAKGRNQQCQSLFEGENNGGGEGGGGGGATPVANFAPYTGTFGIKEAQRLYTRFAYGASRAELDAAVSAGLTATVDKLLTWQNEPALEAQALDIRCDEWLEREEEYFDDDPDDDNRECNPNNPLDFDEEGFLQSMLHTRRLTKNPLIYRLVDFFHDERMAAQCGATQGNQDHYQIQHFAFLESVAKSMDYAKFIREVKDDPLVAYLNLDLGENSVFNALQSPNENFAREWLELASTSPTYKGEPVYTPLDVAQLALALTGRGYNNQEVTVGFQNGVEQTVDLMNPAIVPNAFVPGNKTLFAGTAFEQTIVDADDAADAILGHPSTYYHFAQELLEEFLLGNPAEASIEALAADIQKDGGKFKNALRRIMLSQEFFNENNKRSLVKSPLELTIGFLRQTEYPYSFRNLEDNLRDLGFLLCNPGNRNAGQIFGWDNLQTASEAFVIERRNVIIDMMNYLRDTLPEEWNYDLYEVFVKDLAPGLNPADGLVRRTAELLGLELNPQQIAEAIRLVDYDYETCNGDEDERFGCVDGEKFAKRNTFESASDADQAKQNRKVRRLLTLLATLDDYNLR